MKAPRERLRPFGRAVDEPVFLGTDMVEARFEPDADPYRDAPRRIYARVTCYGKERVAALRGVDVLKRRRVVPSEQHPKGRDR